MDVGFANAAEEFKLDEETILQLQKDAEMRAMAEETYRRINEAQEDPREQRYIQRMDTKGLVKTDEEFAMLQAMQIPMRSVSYGHALKILEESDAAKRKVKAKKKARKVARASRKANR